MSTKIITNPKRVKIQVGDTLRSIASRYLNDQTRWSELVGINNLRPPYITETINSDERIENTLIWGEWIKVPKTDYLLDNDKLTFDDLYGQDIYLNNMDLDVTDSGDLKVVSGVSNLSQAITNRIKCVRGDNFIHNTYGCDIYTVLGMKNTLVVELLAQGLVKIAISEEPRISSINSISSRINGDVLYINAKVTPVDQNTDVDLNLSFPLVR